MTQLLIVDIQTDYQSWLGKHLVSDVKSFCTNFSSIIYMWDDTNGHDIYSQMPDEWIEDEDFYDSMAQINKQYGFLNSFMGIGFEDEEIIRLGKFMIKNKICNSLEIYSSDKINNKYRKEFKGSEMLNYSFESYPVSLPNDLIESIRLMVHSGVVLVGGGRSECLKEISLLLHILDIEHSIHGELTY